MGKESGIQWTDHTFNPWWGCEKVSPGCASCYAEAWANRLGVKVWGDRATRRIMSEKYWIQPHKWDVEAKRDGVRRRVFCASMADVFERRPGLQPIRERLWTLIEETSGLDWLLLTKRPENVLDMIPDSWKRSPRRNVWWGASVESQEYAARRIPPLLEVPGFTWFLSCEPLLGPLNLSRYLRCHQGGPAQCGNRPGECCECAQDRTTNNSIEWVILGGESGPGARPARVRWIRSLVAQCHLAKTPVFVKQLGGHVVDRNDAGFDGHEPGCWPDGTETDDWDLDPSRQYQGADARILLRDKKGGDPAEWPEDLRIRELPGGGPREVKP